MCEGLTPMTDRGTEGGWGENREEGGEGHLTWGRVLGPDQWRNGGDWGSGRNERLGGGCRRGFS